MGKYMRKCSRGAMGEEVAAMEVAQVVGVRTRSRSAAAAGAVVKVQAPKRRKSLPAAVDASLGDRGGGGGCYLQLRSRMLFMASPAAPAPAPAQAPTAEAAVAAAGLGASVAPGLSRCSSTASSVDAAAQDRSLACRSGAAEAGGGEHTPEGSASNNSESSHRERRETTPSSRMPSEVSDLESDLSGPKLARPSPSPARVAAAEDAARARMMPPASEIEAFFAAAEEAEAKRFAAKYNFDVARGVPLDAGRFEWTPVASR